MDRIIAEVFTTLIANGNTKDILYFYNVNKEFRRLMETPFVMKHLSNIPFSNFVDLVHYFQIGLPVYQFITKDAVEHFPQDLKSWLIENWVNKPTSRVLRTGLRIDWRTRRITDIVCTCDDDLIAIVNKGWSKCELFVNTQLQICYINDKFADKTLNRYIKYYIPFKYPDLIARKRKWMTEKPWLKILNKTPEEAVNILTSLGW